MDYKCSIKFIMITLFILLLASSVYGFGVTSDYNSQAPLTLMHDQSKQFSIVLQNMIGGEDLITRVEILEGKKFISVEKNEYVVPFGRQDISVNFVASASKDIPIGEYNISIMFRVTSKNLKEGMVQFSSGSEIRFKLIVTEETMPKSLFNKIIESSITLTIVVILLIIVLLAIFSHIIKKRNR